MRPGPLCSLRNVALCTMALLGFLGNGGLLAQTKAASSAALEKNQQLARLIEAHPATMTQPRQWGQVVSGVKTRLQLLDPKQPVVALTLDACGSARDGYDRELIAVLRKYQVPATLFLNKRWIARFPRAFRDLASDPLFSIQNHGTKHVPCAVTQRHVFGIASTASAGGCYDEIEQNARQIEALTGQRSRYYRSGTAYYDEAGVLIAEMLGHQVVGYSLLGDQGASRSKKQVKAALLTAEPGDIVILHMNHPRGGTAEGVKAALPRLLELGYQFVHLDAYPLAGPEPISPSEAGSP